MLSETNVYGKPLKRVESTQNMQRMPPDQDASTCIDDVQLLLRDERDASKDASKGHESSHRIICKSGHASSVLAGHAAGGRPTYAAAIDSGLFGRRGMCKLEQDVAVPEQGG